MRGWFVTAAIMGLLAVVLGAIGQHALQDMEPHALGGFKTGAVFHMYHALAMGLAALAIRVSPVWAARAAWAFLAGIILFSGSLYLWAFTGLHVLGFTTPLGGLMLMIGWGLLAVAGWKAEV
ncbi:MAG TPA: DUF423 domain-containing protein [Rhizomicrobium sp.]|nr:DUF423 domain-containing protein [Rhizomicrobium sp.]